MCLLFSCSAECMSVCVYIYLFVCGCSRKVRMSKWKEGQRRSPRISASHPCEAQRSRRVGRTALAPPPQAMGLQVQHSRPQDQGPASRTRARKKRKLRPVDDVAATSLSPFAQQVLMLFISSPFSFFFVSSNQSYSFKSNNQIYVFLLLLVCVSTKCYECLGGI